MAKPRKTSRRRASAAVPTSFVSMSPAATSPAAFAGSLTQDEAFARLNVQVDLIPAGASNRPGTPIVPTHITIHNTANAGPGADALMHARYVKGPDARKRQVSWHFTVDDRVCIKHLPTREKGWHAGSGNGRSIGIEICEHAGIDRNAAIDRASLLTAVLALALDIPVEHVVPHRFWTGKDCPRVVLREAGGFEAFRARVADYLEQLRAPATFALASTDGVPTRAMSMADLTRADASADAIVGPVGALDDEAPLSFAAMPFTPGPPAAPTAMATLNAMVPVPTAEAGATDQVAQLERLVGRLTLENHLLRAALAEARELTHEME
jgi:hypothetical protein